MGSKLRKSEIVYFCQMIVVYVIIVTSIVNLSLQNGKNELWITILSSAIGYALPTLKVAKP
jgi:FtsH-binding integral membrane protein